MLSLSALSTFKLIMLHNNISVINATPVVTPRSFPLRLVRKNVCRLLAVMYLTSAPQQQLDDFCNGALTELLFHILLRNSNQWFNFNGLVILITMELLVVFNFCSTNFLQS